MEAIKGEDNIQSIKSNLKKQQRQLFLKRFLANKLMVSGSIIFVLLLIIALIGPVTHVL